MTTSEDTEIHIARRDLLTLAGAAGGLALTGQDWGAADAYRMGLVQEVTAPGQQLDRATELPKPFRSIAGPS